jgi:tetratricopeptide (TPR) repeat protein
MMVRPKGCAPLALAVAVAALALAPIVEAGAAGPTTADILELSRSDSAVGRMRIEYPLDQTLFPPEIIAPTFVWSDESENVDGWFILVRLQNEAEPLRFSASTTSWRPSKDDWEHIKRASVENDAEITIVGVDGDTPESIRSAANVRIRTSEDRVADSIFYREVPLPFLSAIRDPSRIRWRFGAIDSETAPPIVLENLPVCGNCHSFSAKGGVLGLDVDYGNDKGAYAIIPVEEQMVMDDSKIITWADYKKEDDELTFGLLSQVSPDGRYVVSTVKDRAVFVATPEITFSQLFFPIKGILVIYDRETKEFHALPGADDPDYVQSNPTWSPDGKEIVFARSKVYDVSKITAHDAILLDERDVPEFIDEKKPFRFDLYKIPFNGGKGGVATPLAGASADGKSNFFAKYSPDGKWIVFCKANSYMLLQPDSELYIIPAEGGVARRLRYNTSRMNSWHSWSSNSRWLVFSSKVNTPYTQLFLTHIDENGLDSPPVLLERFTGSDRAANIPEFVDLPANAIAKIREQFLDAYSFLRAGTANERTGDYEGAQRSYKRGLELEPENVDLLNALGWALFQQGKASEAVAVYEQALEVDPTFIKARNNAALATVELGQLDRAVYHYRKSLETDPKAEIYSDLGFVLYRQGKRQEAVESYESAIELDPDCASAHFNLAVALVAQNDLDGAALHYREASRVKPNAQAYNGLGFVLSKQGRTQEAIEQLRAAIDADPDYTAAYNNLAAILVEEGRLQEAAANYRTSLAQRPSAAIYNDLGVVLMRLGQTDDAVEAFRNAVGMDRGYVEARKNLAAARSLRRP